MIACKFCEELDKKINKAIYIAPQYTGGDEDGHVEWHPVCPEHLATWYDDIPEDRQLPAFPLTEAHHERHPDHSLLTR